MTYVFNIKRSRVVAGLRWLPLAGAEGASPKAELVEAAAQYGVERPTHGLLLATTDGGQAYGAVVPGGAPASANDGYSGAAWLAKTVRGPTLLVQRAPTRDRLWWIVLARPGSVDPSTDTILPESQAIERIERALFDAYNQSEVIRVMVGGEPPDSDRLKELPWEGDIEGDVTHHPRKIAKDLEGYMGDEAPPRDVRVHQISGVPRALVYVAVLAVVGVAALVGGNVWMKKQKAAKEFADLQAQVAQQQIAQEQMNTMRDVRIAQAVAQALAEDTATPEPSHVLQSCALAYQSVGVEAAGWIVTNIECTSGAAVARVTLERRDQLSNNAGLAAWADDRQWSVSVNTTGLQASLTVPLPTLDVRTALKPTMLPNLDGVVLRDGARIQAFQSGGGAQAQMTPPTPKSITYLDPEKENSEAANERFQPVPPERSYQVGTISINGSGIWMMGALPLDAAHMSVTRVQIQPQPIGAAGDKYTVEAKYVVSNA